VVVEELFFSGRVTLPVRASSSRVLIRSAGWCAFRIYVVVEGLCTLGFISLVVGLPGCRLLGLFEDLWLHRIVLLASWFVPA
jgi:hypothetical protein